MSPNPDTRESLILRLPTLSDAAAWQQFVTVYEPLVLRFARRRGRLRAWLFRIARNQLINLVSRKRPNQGSGRSEEWQVLNQLQAPDATVSAAELDNRRELFRTAFRAASAMAVLRRICHDAHRSLDGINSDSPHELCELVDRLLQKSAAARFQTKRNHRSAIPTSDDQLRSMAS